VTGTPTTSLGDRAAGFVPIVAHVFGKRYDLPVPLWLFVFGGAAVVFLSFLLVLPRAVAAASPAERPQLALFGCRRGMRKPHKCPKGVYSPHERTWSNRRRPP